MACGAHSIRDGGGAARSRRAFLRLLAAGGVGVGVAQALEGARRDALAGGLAFELLELEAACRPVSGEQRRMLERVVADGCAGVRGVLPEAGNRGGREGRRAALRALGALDSVLVRLGFVHPASGAVEGLADSLEPFVIGPADRGAFESRKENERRLGMMAARVPGPFHAVDCDTASFVYLTVAERLGLPLRMVLTASCYRRRSHAWVRWREGRVRIDWETTEGRERGGDVEERARKGDSARRAFRVPEFELTREQVLGCGHYLAAVRWGRVRDWDAAYREYGRALRLFPDHLDARRQWAWELATVASARHRDPEAALVHARYVVERVPDADARDTLGAAYAAAGQFDRAIREVRAAVSDGEASAGDRAAYRGRLELYLQGKPYRQRPGAEGAGGGGSG